MRTLLFVFLFASKTLVIAQAPIYKLNPVSETVDSSNYVSSIQYLVGTNKVPGYKVSVCNLPYTYADTKVFSNGKSAPILQFYVDNKSKYVGGILENETGKTTVIKNIILTESENTLLFTVVGDEFSMSFSLITGSILKEDGNVTVFYTDNIGSWKINKKK